MYNNRQTEDFILAGNLYNSTNSSISNLGCMYFFLQHNYGSRFAETFEQGVWV